MCAGDARGGNVAEGVTAVSPSEHPAVRAWGRLGSGGVVPVGAVERLQKKKKGCVYRLRGVGPGGGDVVGKVSSAERIARERVIYERVLPTLPVTGVEYYGYVEEPDGAGGWIFVEDAGGEAYSPRCDRHRALAGRWLAQLHVSAAAAAAGIAPGDGLAERGPGYYLSQLRGAREELAAHVSNPALGAAEVALMREVARQCEVAEAHWGEVRGWAEGAPAAFIHGDFAPKNMRVRAGRRGDVLLPYDWGSAGYGSVAADLAQAGVGGGDSWDYWAHPDLEAYLAGVREVWRDVTARDVRMLAVVGKLFRCLVCVCLEAPSFAYDYVERAVSDLKVYRAAMADALGALGWDQ